MSAKGVFTLNERVTFVEKTAGDVGDGKAYPIQVLLDHVAEIYFRVSDAYFTAGSIRKDITGGGLYTQVDASTTAPANRCNQGIAGDDLRRGYVTPVTEGAATISAHNLAYLTALYDAGNGDDFRDIDDNERGIWIEGEVNVTLPRWNEQFTTAFAHSFYNATQPAGTDYFQGKYAFDFTPPVSIYPNSSVVLNGEIAVIKNDPGDSMFAPTNSYYLGIKFAVTTASAICDFSTLESDIAGTPEIACNYVIRLSTGDLTCPLYVDGVGWEPDTASDFIHEAKAWFPYAKAGGPVWDSGTGLAL